MDQSTFIDAAVALSVSLRSAKVEAALRPRVFGTLLAAIAHGDIETTPERALASLNAGMAATVRARAGSGEVAERIIAALTLSGADFAHLAPFVDRSLAALAPLGLHDLLQGDTDVLGTFYEAFLRYGYDNNALGIVFTPRHITRFCVELTGAGARDAIFDPAAGTGGFLIAALDRMGPGAHRVRGFDTNPTTWALANLNLLFRGMPADAVIHASCFAADHDAEVRGRFTRAYLNPPFAQAHEAEVAFIDVAMNALTPGGLVAAVIYAGVFADDDHLAWRRAFVAKHSVLALISLPEELFYPTAAPTSILIARAHAPQGDEPVFMARIWNDGFEKRKGRRVPKAGAQLTEVAEAFHAFLENGWVESDVCASIEGERFAAGHEWSPQQWLAQPAPDRAEVDAAQAAVVHAVLSAAVHFPALATRALPGFADAWRRNLPPLAYGTSAPLSEFFDLVNGRSAGEKNFGEGDTPYISSGDATNSIVSLVTVSDEEVFALGGISVTAFGQAAVQPWPFAARGNGGSAVRVLLPRHAMSVRELVWFAAQINLQRWRFFYARMAIKSRLAAADFRLSAPASPLTDAEPALAARLSELQETLAQAAAL